MNNSILVDCHMFIFTCINGHLVTLTINIGKVSISDLWLQYSLDMSLIIV